jgi:hypothetical protein
MAVIVIDDVSASNESNEGDPSCFVTVGLWWSADGVAGTSRKSELNRFLAAFLSLDTLL